MTLRELIKQAVSNHDPAAAGEAVDRYRALGATYQDILARVQLHHPDVTAAAWDALLSEADELEAHRED